MMIRPVFLLALTASMVLVSCSAKQPASAESVDNMPAGETEKLLAAEGSWNLVEEDKSASPTQQHMAARGQVNPKQLSNKRSYTSTPNEAEISENVHFRVLRLESEMAGLRGDFNKLLPPLSNLIKADNSLDQAVSDIQAGQASASAAPVVPEKLAGDLAKPPAMDKPKVKATPKPIQTAAASPLPAGAPVVTGLRLGEHPGKTRIVLDTSAPVSFTYNIDNSEHVLLVDLPGSGWSAEMQRALAAHPLIKSYSVQTSAAGATVAVELAKDAKVVMSTAMKPNEVYGHRVVLDLAAL
jgi:hypothetical protein